MDDDCHYDPHEKQKGRTALYQLVEREADPPGVTIVQPLTHFADYLEEEECEETERQPREDTPVGGPLSLKRKVDEDSEEYKSRMVQQKCAIALNTNILELNNFSLKSVPESVAESENLYLLDLSANDINRVPDFVANLDRLRKLRLNHNLLVRFPPVLLKLTNLTHLYLNHNYLKAIPDEIGDMIRLKTIDFSVNQISRIPDSVTRLSSLTQLLLHRNEIESLPEKFHKMKSLETLCLQQNPLSLIPSHILSSNSAKDIFAFLKMQRKKKSAEGEGGEAASSSSSSYERSDSDSDSEKERIRETGEDGKEMDREEKSWGGRGEEKMDIEISSPNRVPLASHKRLKLSMEFSEKVAFAKTPVFPSLSPLPSPLSFAGSSPLPSPVSSSSSSVNLTKANAVEKDRGKMEGINGSFEVPSRKRPREGESVSAEVRLKQMEALLQQAQGRLLEEQSARRDWQQKAMQLQEERVGGRLLEQVVSYNEMVKSSPMEPNFKYEIPYHELEFKQMIGSGGFGDVYRGSWKGTVVAIKTLRKSPYDQKILDELKNEVALMCTLRHPNIILFMGACTRPPQPCIVTEFLALGSLADVIENDKINLTWGLKFNIMLDIARGINYLHSRTPPIIHRDLKSDNIMIAKDFRAVVADFGLAKVRYRTYAKTNCGTPGYTAPEILNDEEYTEKADIYSYGMILWETVTREFVFSSAENPYKIVKDVEKGIRPPIPDYCPSLLSALMQQCWLREPKERPNAGVIIGAVKHIIDHVLPTLRPLPFLQTTRKKSPLPPT